jgi:hypothetical protein
MKLLCICLISLGIFACDDDDDGGSEAQRRGIGAACEASDECAGEGDAGLDCLPFKGGYCGDRGCLADTDCPAGSACVAFEGANYCFLVCNDKPECNIYRPVEDEANCSSSAEFVEETGNRKACIPPSGS